MSADRGFYVRKSTTGLTWEELQGLGKFGKDKSGKLMCHCKPP